MSQTSSQFIADFRFPGVLQHLGSAAFRRKLQETDGFDLKSARV